MSSNLESLLFQALEETFGIRLSTTNAEALRQKLYAVRKASSIFLPLSFIVLSKTELWIVKTKVEIDENSSRL